ncbi:SAM-dependent methyltransferase [Vallitalea longa]|uniref:SAM-dependent methyltransferase n=1 Tax=Vallitalea longa TaxID=2936439 RepID=A0A9W5YAX8_9FIRM|nr:DNA adenine methylase [Vallitalea longa]GKX29033.1 SAM-dependent methyltransferase [Vallitalea longa]
MRAILKYPGSKWNLADWIINKIPKHHTYLEPFFGSGAIFFKKASSNIELINDIDGTVCALFRIVRDSPEELARLIALTPFAREEYDRTYEDGECSEIEKVRRFLVQCWQGHGFRTNGYKVGWKNDIQGREQMYAAYNWYRLPSWIIQIADRLKNCQIDNRPAVELIKRFNYKNVFIYLDPPYVLGTRTGKQYKYEMTDNDHIELLETVLNHKGMTMISGYNSDLYNEYLKGWHKEKVPATAEYGLKRTECIWYNYELSSQISLFELTKTNN